MHHKKQFVTHAFGYTLLGKYFENADKTVSPIKVFVVVDWLQVLFKMCGGDARP